mmetsp:Transcript_60014/g.115743  ORF Transcript_60014/g.115743 Transcript_60014/m.115743 type:complete len:202 (+) Transcript_60014:642-1247(+)
MFCSCPASAMVAILSPFSTQSPLCTHQLLKIASGSASTAAWLTPAFNSFGCTIVMISLSIIRLFRGVSLVRFSCRFKTVPSTAAVTFSNTFSSPVTETIGCSGSTLSPTFAKIWAVPLFSATTSVVFASSSQFWCASTTAAGGSFSPPTFVPTSASFMTVPSLGARIFSCSPPGIFSTVIRGSSFFTSSPTSASRFTTSAS